MKFGIAKINPPPNLEAFHGCDNLEVDFSISRRKLRFGFEKQGRFFHELGSSLHELLNKTTLVRDRLAADCQQEQGVPANESLRVFGVEDHLVFAAQRFALSRGASATDRAVGSTPVFKFAGLTKKSPIRCSAGPLRFQTVALRKIIPLTAKR